MAPAQFATRTALSVDVPAYSQLRRRVARSAIVVGALIAVSFSCSVLFGAQLSPRAECKQQARKAYYDEAGMCRSSGSAVQQRQCVLAARDAYTDAKFGCPTR